LQVKQWPSTTILAQLVDKTGLAINASSPREADLVRWLTQLARARFHAQLATDAARLLVELVGPEAGLLASEVEKLSVYAGETKRIERADIIALVGAGRVETIWKALDAATTGEAREALKHLEDLLGAGEQPVQMLAAMSSSLLKIHHAGRLRAARVKLDEACRLAGIQPFALDKTRKQHAHLGPQRVDQLPATLLKADLDTKGGSSLDPRTILEILLVRLALPRID
jgi:DNA polymerase-3 subunit delta